MMVGRSTDAPRMSASRCIVVDRLAAVRSHTSVVSRWLVMPIAAKPRAGKPGHGECLAAGRHHRAPQILRIMFNPAGLQERGISCWAMAATV
jgi:hypothetical protein